MRPRTTLIVGVGNVLAGNDSFGEAVISRLRGREDRPAGVDLLDAGTDLLGHIETFAAYDAVILVDAVVRTGHTGAVAVFDERTTTAWPHDSPGAHQLSPLMAIRLFRVLHPDADTRVTLVALGTDRIRLGAHLAEDVVAAGAAAVARLWS